MQKYEVMVIVQNDRASAEALAFTKEQVVKKINGLGGKVTFEDFWGERGFAYKIKGMKWGYYFVCQFDAEADVPKQLTKDWNITKGMVRFMISKVDKKAPAPISYADMQKNWVKQAQEADIAEIDEGVKVAAPAAPAAPKKDAVDKKLDAVLDSSSVSL